MKKGKLSLIALSACMLILSACGGGNKPTSQSSQVSDSSESVNSSINSNDNSSTGSQESSSSASSSIVSSSVQENFTVNVEANELVTIVVNGGNTHKKGENVSVKLTPKAPNVRIDQVKVLGANNAEIATTEAGDTYTFVMPESNVTIKVTAHEEATEYSITVAANAEATVTIQGNLTKAVAGTNIVLTAVANSQYKVIDKVIVTDANGEEIGVGKGSDNQYSFLMPESNVTISTVVANKKYTITMAENPNASLAIIGLAESFEAGTEVMISVSANYGHQLKSVSAKGKTSGANVPLTKGSSNYTLTMPLDDVIVTVVTSQMYTITCEADSNIALKVDNQKDYYAEGSEVTFSATSTNTKFVIDTVSVKNGNQDVPYTVSGSKYTFTMPKGNVVIKATQKTNSSTTGDPFTSPMSFEGSWSYYNYYSYLMRLRVYFNGNGQASYCLTYDDDDYYDDYDYTRPNLDTITLPKYESGTKPSTMSDMQGDVRDSHENADYVYNNETNQVIISFRYGTAVKDIRFEIYGTATNVTAIKPLDNLGVEYGQCANTILNRI